MGRLGLGEVASQDGVLCIEAGLGQCGSWQVLLLTDNIKCACLSWLQGQGPAEPLWELGKALLLEEIVKGTLWVDAAPPWGTAECLVQCLPGQLSRAALCTTASLSSLIWCLCPLLLCPTPLILHTAARWVFLKCKLSLLSLCSKPFDGVFDGFPLPLQPSGSCRSGPS